MREAAPDLRGMDEVEALVARLRDPQEVKRLLASITRQRHVGIYNAMLVYLQRPDAEVVMRADEWRSLGRLPKADARPLVILWPFGPVSFVFDHRDTEGRPLPENLESHLLSANALGAEGAITNGQLSVCYAHCRGIGLEIRERPQGVMRGGSIQNRGTAGFLVALNEATSAVRKFATLCHELAHLFCGHVGECERLGVSQRLLPLPAREAEAELAAYLVCRRRGVETSTPEYLAAHFSRPGVEAMSLEVAVRAAGRVEQVLGGNGPKAWRRNLPAAEAPRP